MLTTTKLYDIFHIVNGEHSDPHTVLGMHEMEEDGRKAVVVRAFLPDAAGITVIDYANKRKKYPMERLHADGFFEVTIADREEWFRYQLEYTDADGNTWRSYDPYSFSPTLSEFDRHLFGAGTHYEIYEKMGGRLMTHEGARGAAFSVWAPNAKAVSVIGDFNNWDARRSPMRRLGESGIWELFLPAAAEGDKYKFHVTQCDGRVVDKTDPYGVYAEVRPNNASVLYPLKRYKWKDRRWMTARRKYDFRTAPMNIYEVHLGSWKRAEGDRFLTYTELAEQLIPYVKEMGYTHIEMLPVEEHPFDGSWGYQVTGYYAPTSRYGSPDEFKQFMDWMDIFHIDGLRVDAVASLLRLDFCKEEGQWLPNVYGGSENLEAIEFLKHMNSVIAEREPGALMIAEDSTAWPGVTKKVDEGGLGFSLKWNMGWMNDFLSYIKLDPIYRKYHQNKLTFGMAYHYAENFVLVLSHDEVVHTKSSMIGKMPGDVWQSFANLRLSYGFMMGHPGKKLLFMGGEFAQYSEWSEARSLDWHLLQYADHQEMQAYVKELNHLYTEEPAFWAEDFDPNGFQWIECDDAESSIVSFVRRSKEKELVFLCNFTPVVHRGFSLGVPQEGVYHERLNSDAARFGGSDVINAVPLQSKAEPAGRCPFRVELDVPPLGMVILEREQPKKQPRTKKPKTRTAANGTKTDAKRKHPEKNTEKTAKQADLP